MDAAGHHGCREVVWAGDDVGDDFGVLRIWDRGFDDANDRSGSTSQEAAAEKNGLADDARIFPKAGGPEAISENDDAAGFGPNVSRLNETPQDRGEPDSVAPGAA